MHRLVWPLGLVVAFSGGLAGGTLLRPAPSPTEEIERLQAAESRLQAQVSTLQARLRARETTPGGQQSIRSGQASWNESRSELAQLERTWASARAEDRARAGRGGRPQEDLTSSGRVAKAIPSTAPTVDAALERFYRFLDESGGSTGPGRWQRMRQLVDDFRTMGDAGVEALMRVLAGGTNSDERRAAAQLLGELQAAQALPALQEILDKDSDVLLRRAAAAALRRLQSPDSAPVLESLLANAGEDRFVRMSAALGLAQLGRSLGVNALAQIFDESNADGRGRELAFRALSSLEDERPLPFMRRVLTSGAEVSYRLQAIRFLAAQGDRQSLPALQQVMQSPIEQPSIRDAATQAHAAISAR
jgi:hypothetical protein